MQLAKLLPKLGLLMLMPIDLKTYYADTNADLCIILIFLWCHFRKKKYINILTAHNVLTTAHGVQKFIILRNIQKYSIMKNVLNILSFIKMKQAQTII